MLVTFTVKLLLYLPKNNVCFLGYELGADGRTCVDVDECDFLNGGCDQVSFLCLQTKISNQFYAKWLLLIRIPFMIVQMIIL